MSKNLHSNASTILFERAVELRKQPTKAEEMLWEYLKTKPLGFKFRRQHPYFQYIFDFYCHSLKFIIEVDGSIHEKEDVKLNDLKREELLIKDRMIILRINNDEIFYSLDNVIKKIEIQLNQLSNKRM